LKHIYEKKTTDGLVSENFQTNLSGLISEKIKTVKNSNKKRKKKINRGGVAKKK